MLRSLKTATESYLVDVGFVAGLSTANIILPFPLSPTYKDVIRTAATSVSLKAQLAGGHPAGIFAALAHGITHECGPYQLHSKEGKEAALKSGDPPPRLVLTVDYSQAALTAVLFIEECGSY